MVFENIEKLKSEYTDKFVVVDENRPELLRFRDMTGTVKTVNMNGRALVEFDGHQNIGWYDIAVDYLRVVDKPIEKPVAEKKPPAKAKPKAAAKKAAAKPAAGSAADILAAARGGSAAAAPKKAASPEDILAAARGGSKAAEKKSDPAAMSAADILAAARGGTATAAPAEQPAAAEPEPEPEPAAAPEPKAEDAAPAAGQLPTEVDDILKFCRERDS